MVMRRYIPITRCGSDDGQFWAPSFTAETVHEQVSEPVATGIYDQHGVMLYRVEEREPIGFKVREKE